MVKVDVWIGYIGSVSAGWEKKERERRKALRANRDDYSWHETRTEFVFQSTSLFLFLSTLFFLLFPRKREREIERGREREKTSL